MPVLLPSVTRRQKRRMAPRALAALGIILGPSLHASVYASDHSGQVTLEPAEIDRAVIAFTGAAIGEVGGARARADQRLRLAACAAPLATSWHGTTRAAVKVECAAPVSDTGPWRIFIATRPAAPGVANAAPTARPAKAAPVIKRGDPITVLVRGRGFTVQQTGEAMGNGAVGDWIAVRTARQAEPVRARIERPGLAVIPIG